MALLAYQNPPPISSGGYNTSAMNKL